MRSGGILKATLPGDGEVIAPEQADCRGQLRSYNRAPAPDLAPWIARLYVVRCDAPRVRHLDCGLFSDVPVVRIQLAGKWAASTADGPQACSRAALFCGPHSRHMPISVTGSFISVGIAVRPGACTAMQALRVEDYVDRIVPTDEYTHRSDHVVAMFAPDRTPEQWLQMLEDQIRLRAARTGWTEPDPVSARFERAAFADPSISVAQFLRDTGMERRTFERIVRRDFGMSPKQVLRRARALDMASHLRGVADDAEAEELALRYYDESHLIREFDDLFGMSPRRFMAMPQPILTLELEARQARRLEMIDRLAPGETCPWQ